jgi:beta-glucosidase
MTKTETANIIKDGGFKICATESLGIYETEEADGPSGVSRVQEQKQIGWPAQALTACSWNEALLYTQGRAVGKSAIDNDIQGWYAPGVNLHRSPYTSRNFEYYSEDPILSGKLAAKVIRGAKNEGLICYLKHFAVSEGGRNPAQVNTWLTEQTMRETYLKAFEIPVKEGKANAVMSAFNNIGDIYCGHNQALLQDILRKEWGFRGSVITDWWGEYMGINQCVMAGNDKMLLKKDTQQYVDLMNNSGASANAARVAVKNIIYSIVDSCVTGGLYERPLVNQDTLEATDEGGAAGAD